MTIARRVIVITAAVVATLVMQPGFAMSKTVIPITKSKPAPSANSMSHPTATQTLKSKSGQTANGHPH